MESIMDREMLKNCIGSLAENVYFCGSDKDGLNATVFVKDEKTRSKLIKFMHQKEKTDAEFRSIKIKTTRSLKLKKTRSLEEILTRVPHQVIHFDPTATIERASILVSIAKEARQLLGPLLKGCYFNSNKRNVYFLVEPNNSTEVLDLPAVQKQLEPIIMLNTQRLSHPFYYSITISSQKPQGSVIAVDKASVVDESLIGLMKGCLSKLKWSLLLVSGLGMTSAATAENGTLPAVSNVNAWLGGAGAYLHNQNTSGVGGIVEGGVAVPLTHALGAQLHTYDGLVGSATLLSIDGYVFWRDPAKALFGPHLLYTKSNSFHHALYGLHGEGYLNSLTLALEGGYATRSNRTGAGYGEAILHWYAQPDWRLYAGAITVNRDVTGAVGTEYQFGLNSLPGLAIFADAGAGSHNLEYGYLGLRYYFGDVNDPNKSLIRRQREDMVLPTLDPIDPIRHSISHIL